MITDSLRLRRRLRIDGSESPMSCGLILVAAVTIPGRHLKQRPVNDLMIDNLSDNSPFFAHRNVFTPPSPRHQVDRPTSRPYNHSNSEVTGTFMAKNIKTRADDYSQWYLDVIKAAQLADYSPVKGCMVIRPEGYAMWEAIQRDLDRRFKDTGHVN